MGRMSPLGCRIPPHHLPSHARLAGRVLIAFAGFLFRYYHGSILQLLRCPAARSPWLIPPPLPFQPPICSLHFCILSWGKKSHFLINFSAWAGFRRPLARLPRAASFPIPRGGDHPILPTPHPASSRNPLLLSGITVIFTFGLKKIIKHQEDWWCGRFVLPHLRGIQHRLPFAPANSSSHMSGCWGGGGMF